MNIDNVNRNNYIYNLKQARKSLELIQQKDNFSPTEILLMLLLSLEIDKAMYELIDKDTYELRKQEAENGD